MMQTNYHSVIMLSKQIIHIRCECIRSVCVQKIRLALTLGISFTIHSFFTLTLSHAKRHIRSVLFALRVCIQINVPFDQPTVIIIIITYNRNNNVDSITLQHNWIFSSFWFNIKLCPITHTRSMHHRISNRRIGTQKHARTEEYFSVWRPEQEWWRECEERRKRREMKKRTKNEEAFYLYIDSFFRQLPYRTLIFLPWADIFHAKIRTFTTAEAQPLLMEAAVDKCRESQRRNRK